MSFRLQPAPPARPNRCQLFGPGSRPALFAKMAASAADVINLDLEDSVAPSDKEAARANIIAAISEVDWGKKWLSVRINGLDTPYWYRDVVDLLEQAGERLDQIMIPKVGCAADVYAVDALVTAIERAKGRSKPIAFEVIIESAAGIAHVEEIAASSPRLQAMSLGAADFAASMGMQTTGIGGTQENYYMLRLSRPAGRMAFCRSMDRSAISRTTRAFARRPCARRLWEWSASGRSTPSRLLWPMRCLRHRRKRSPRRGRFWPRWMPPRRAARGLRFSRGGWLISPRSNRRK
jgi:citrate lyase beta subunit